MLMLDASVAMMVGRDGLNMLKWSCFMRRDLIFSNAVVHSEDQVNDGNSTVHARHCRDSA